MIGKKWIALFLAISMLLALPVSVSAGTSCSYYNGKKVTASCGSKSSWHQVTGGSYPTASGTFTYAYNGRTYSISASGTSYSTYWYGSAHPSSITNGVKATTTYSGYTVTAAL